MHKFKVGEKVIIQEGFILTGEHRTVRDQTGKVLGLSYDGTVNMVYVEGSSHCVFKYESNLIVPIFDQFVRGERVLVGGPTQERIYLATIEGAKFPYVTVAVRDEEAYKADKPFHFSYWASIDKFVEPAVKELTLEQIAEKFGINKSELRIKE